MKPIVKKAIEEYQCSGCISGHNTECFEPCDTGVGCGKHYAGTGVTFMGKIFLGMPKGFNRLGKDESMHPYIFEETEDFGAYDKFNVPVWKYYDEENGCTLVRGLQPRLNIPFIHVIIADKRDKLNCLELTKEDLLKMD